ncbi:MAG: Ig-like domain-containing protein, partial [Nitrososphaerota archaeon]
GIDGYYVSIDDPNPDGKGNLDWKTTNLEFEIPKELSEGNHTVSIASVDKVGLKSNPISYSFVVDRSGPSGQINFETQNQYINPEQIILSLSSADLSSIAEYKLSNDGINWASFSLSSPQKELKVLQSWVLSLPDGEKTVYVKYKDIFGHWSKTFSKNIFLDKTKPSSWINNLSTFQNTLSFLVSWQGLDHLSGIHWFDVQVKDNFTNTWVDWLSHTNLVSAIFEGIDGVTYYFRSRAKDFAGNVEDYNDVPDTQTKVDITAPSPPEIESPQRNSILNATADENLEEEGIQVIVSGKAEANTAITFKIQNDQIIKIYNTEAKADGTWSIPDVTFFEGKNILEVKSTDEAGNFNILKDYFVFLDTKVPAKISDLTVAAFTYHSVTLSWTAPGDDGNTGQAKVYDLRYSKNPIVSDADFGNATKVSSPPIPAIAGTFQTFTVENLEPKETYYFAIKTQDDAENWSEISNSPEAITSTSAYRIELASSKNTIEAEGIEKITLIATVYDQEGNSGPKLSGEPVTFAITDDNGIPAETGNLSATLDNSDGTYTSIYTAATKVGDGKITITVENQQCASQKQDSVDIQLISGAPHGPISLTPNPSSIPANGTSTSTITSGVITDKTGNVVADGEKITVSTNLGTIASSDQDLTLPGIQILTTNGVIQFVLKSLVWNGYGEAQTNAQISAQSVRGEAFGQAQVEFRDVTAPSPPQIIEPQSGTISKDNTPTIKGKAEKNSRVLIYKNGSYHYYTYADSNGNFTYTFGSPLPDGNWTFQARSRDAAGNTSNYSNSISYTIDTQPPQILDFGPKETIYHRDETVFATYQDNAGGVGIDTSKINMKINGSNVPAQITPNKISYQNIFPDKNDTYNVIITVTDKAGNVATATWTFNIQIASYFKSKIDSNHKVFRIYPW